MINKVNILKFALIASVFLLIFSSCGSSLQQENDEKKKLKQDLSVLAQESAKTYFGKSIDIKDFNISLAEKTGNDTFENISSLETENEVYLIGHCIGKPEDVIDFVLSYDMKTKNITSFGVQTVNDKDMVYVDKKDIKEK